MARNTLSRSLHDLGLSAWFGGTLANAVALNAAAAEAGKDTGRVANEGWNRWTPVDAAGNPSARSGTKPTKLTKAEAAQAMAQLDQLQWVVPALTGALVVVSSYAGEQQRPSEVLKGVAEKSATPPVTVA